MWQRLIRRGMAADFGWGESARRYLALYGLLTGGREIPAAPAQETRAADMPAKEEPRAEEAPLKKKTPAGKKPAGKETPPTKRRAAPAKKKQPGGAGGN